jgi:hypothetical protein
MRGLSRSPSHLLSRSPKRFAALAVVFLYREWVEMEQKQQLFPARVKPEADILGGVRLNKLCGCPCCF